MTLFDAINWYSNFYDCRMLLHGKGDGVYPMCHSSWLLFVMWCSMYYSSLTSLSFSASFTPVLSILCHACPWAKLNDDSRTVCRQYVVHKAYKS